YETIFKSLNNLTPKTEFELFNKLIESRNMSDKKSSFVELVVSNENVSLNFLNKRDMINKSINCNISRSMDQGNEVEMKQDFVQSLEREEVVRADNIYVPEANNNIHNYIQNKHSPSKDIFYKIEKPKSKISLTQN